MQCRYSMTKVILDLDNNYYSLRRCCQIFIFIDSPGQFKAGYVSFLMKISTNSNYVLDNLTVVVQFSEKPKSMSQV